MTVSNAQTHVRTTAYALPAVTVSVAQFKGRSGVDEYHLVACPIQYADLTTQINQLDNAYSHALAELGLDANSALLRRIFCSDLPNQAELLAGHPLTCLTPPETCAVSWAGQPPVPPAKIALWAYHVRIPGRPLDKSCEGTSLAWRRGELSHIWTTGANCPENGDTAEQTTGILTQYHAEVHKRGLNIADHVLRTWFFVQDIDTNYRGLVTARKAFFAAHGLTLETHYIASTGIEGTAATSGILVTMDAYAIGGVQREQIQYLAAPDHLCPTHRYGVTFERGVSIAYRDRKHVFISGTASIDAEGNILHPGDVRRQLERTMENIHALLGQAGAGFADVCMFIVYVRDAFNLGIARQMMRELYGSTPMQAVVAPVCRPGWLIEVECMAIVPADNPRLPAF